MVALKALASRLHHPMPGVISIVLRNPTESQQIEITQLLFQSASESATVIFGWDRSAGLVPIKSNDAI